jgi:hypothetical protein
MNKKRLAEGKPSKKALANIEGLLNTIEQPLPTTYIPELIQKVLISRAQRPPLTIAQKKKNAKKRRASKASRKKNR